MENKKKGSGFFKKLKNKYRLIIYNDNSFEEVWQMRLSRLNIVNYLGILVLVLSVLITVLIIYTPIRELVPGYPDGNTMTLMSVNARKADSIGYKTRINNQWIENVQKIFTNDLPEEYTDPPMDTAYDYKNLSFKKSREDSIIRQRIAAEEEYNLVTQSMKKNDNSFTGIKLFPPVKGMITNKFNIQGKHFGIDIASSPDNIVVSTLHGTVVFSSWTMETGFVMQVQHDNNLISVYKHLSKTFKKQGEPVKSGESIGVVGNSGELTTGTHLHFELWFEGKPLDPLEFISF